jgi:hypothetical protein
VRERSTEFEGQKNEQQMRVQTIRSVTWILSACLAGILKEMLFPPVPPSKLIPAPKAIPKPNPFLAPEATPVQEAIWETKSIPNPEPTSHSEGIAVLTLASANEEQSVPSWESQGRNLPADYQISWTVIVGLCCSINILTVLVYRKHLRGEIKQQMSQIRMWLEEEDKLRLETEAMLASIKENENHHHAQFLKEMVSMRRILEAEGKRSAGLQNETDPLAMCMKGEGKRSELKNETDPLAMYMKAVGKRSAELKNETDPLAMCMKGDGKRSAELKNETGPLEMCMKGEGKRSAELKNETGPLWIFKKVERKRSELKNDTDPLAKFKKTDRKRCAEFQIGMDPMATFTKAEGKRCVDIPKLDGFNEDGYEGGRKRCAELQNGMESEYDV